MSADDPNESGAETLRRLGRMLAPVEATASVARRTVGSRGFPWRAPTVPYGVDVPEEPSRLGADFDTDFARRTPARTLRRVLTEGPVRLFVSALADPEILGTDRLADLSRLDDPPPLIFAPNHHSHLDTPLMAVAVPMPWRHRLVVAAAADYFFTSRAKGTAAALTLNALPIDREATSRSSSDRIRALVDDGWSLVIYPEGGRSPDGWGQSWKGGAAYLSARTNAAVVPVFIDGTGAIFGKGMKRPRPGRTRIVFGRPMSALEGESTRRFAARIEAAVSRLADESLTDSWTAARRAAAGTSPSLTGPDVVGWRRQWALSQARRNSSAGQRRRQRRRWPDLGD
jgi:1-acyl-sn-glycerol-3-phosphate acyltransferase